MVDTCCATKQPNSIQARLRATRQRMLWPFRKNTLLDLQATLSGFQDDLILALQCAGLRTLQTLGDIPPKLTAEIFWTLARRLAPFKPNRPGLLHSYPATMLFPYHTHDLSGVAAEAAWAAGYDDLQSAQYTSHVSGSELYGAPLWLAVTTSTLCHAEDVHTFENGRAETTRWLLDHGADLTWTHPIFCTTSAHALARDVCTCTIETNRRPGFKAVYDIRDILDLEQIDACICHCSSNGCTTIGCATSKHIKGCEVRCGPQRPNLDRSLIRENIFLVRGPSSR
jgi:hypothetical protein